MFSQIVITLLALSATADGASTAYAIRRGNIEVDPIMVAIFGMNRPTTKTIFLRGGIAITIESAILLLLSHFHPTAGHVLSSGLLAQTGYHVWATIHNFRLK